jgi:hypothetical protein
MAARFQVGTPVYVRGGRNLTRKMRARKIHHPRVAKPNSTQQLAAPRRQALLFSKNTQWRKIKSRWQLRLETHADLAIQENWHSRCN